MNRLLLRSVTVRWLLLLLSILIPCQAGAQQSVENIHREVLDNGLTLIVAEDRSAPRVAVHLWYRVGSVDDPPGRSGFAHLFEHLMFRGSENAPDDYWADMRRIGATETNAGTAPDRTTYFQTVPTGALEYVLWREADRMAALTPMVTQKTLNSERAVVENELRQNRSGPAGSVWTRIAGATYPDHPYARDTLGEIEELAEADLEEVRAFHRRYYTPANAILVLAGDVAPACARELVERHFGPIPSGERVAGAVEWPAPLSGARRDVVADAVPSPRIFRVWNLPGYGSPEAIDLGLFGDVLRQRLEAAAGDSALVTTVSAYVIEQGLSSQIVIDATSAEGTRSNDVEAWISQQTELAIAHMSDARIAAAAAKRRANLLARMERLGGFGGRADTIASSEGFNGDPTAWRFRLARYAEPEADAVRAAARNWVGANHYTLVFEPSVSLSNQAITRPIAPPPIGETASFVPPDPNTTTLAGGAILSIVERSGDLARLALILPGAERSDVRAGVREVALAALLDQRSAEGASVREALNALGATLTLEKHPEAVVALLQVPSDAFLAAAPILIRAIDLGGVGPETFAASLAGVRGKVSEQQANVLSLPSHLVPELYGRQAASSETLANVESTDLQEMSACWRGPGLHAIYVGPDPADMIAPLRADLESHGAGNPSNCSVEYPKLEGSEGIAVGMPGRQALILAALPLPPVGAPDSEGLEAALSVLTENTTGRLDRILRVERGLTYGIRTTVSHRTAERLLTIEVPVSEGNAGEARAIVERELQRIAQEPIEDHELRIANASLSAQREANWQTGDRAALALAHSFLDGGAVTIGQANADQVRRSAARYLVHPPTWIVAGPAR